MDEEEDEDDEEDESELEPELESSELVCVVSLESSIIICDSSFGGDASLRASELNSLGIGETRQKTTTEIE